MNLNVFDGMDGGMTVRTGSVSVPDVMLWTNGTIPIMGKASGFDTTNVGKIGTEEMALTIIVLVVFPGM